MEEKKIKTFFKRIQIISVEITMTDFVTTIHNE